MVWTLFDELKFRIHVFLSRLFGHIYGCCGKVTKRCSKCEHCKTVYGVVNRIPKERR